MSKEPLTQLYRFGRTKPGGIPAMRLAIPIGLPLAVIFGIVIQMASGNRHGPYNPWLRGTAIGICVAPIVIALIWVLCVDRSTIPDAPANPENSIEKTWYGLAAQDAFHAVLIGTGIGSTLSSFWLPSMVTWTLVAVWFCTALAFTISYLIRKSRQQ